MKAGYAGAFFVFAVYREDTFKMVAAQNFEYLIGRGDARTGHHSAVSRCAGHCTVEDVGHFGFELNQQFTRVDIGGKPDFRPPIGGDGRLFDDILFRTGTQRQGDKCDV